MENKEKNTPGVEQEALTEKVVIDQDRIDKAQKKLDDVRKENASKEYLVKMTPNLLEFFENFMRYHAPWKGKEALGVMEVIKKIDKIKASGIRDNACYLSNLHIEATHYFLGKYEGKGTSIVDEYVELYKNIENSLNLVGADNQKAKDLEKELIAAQQGIETC